jgi:hypothetical protein
MQVAFEEREPPILQLASPAYALSLEEDVPMPMPTTYEQHVIDIGTDLELQPATTEFCESITLPDNSCDLHCTIISVPCAKLIISNFDHVVLITHKEVLARIPSVDIVCSIMLNKPINFSFAMNKISEISYLNSSTYSYCFMFNLIGEYSMNGYFLVDHICITCDRIMELKIVVFSPICYVSQSFCVGIVDHVRDIKNINYVLVDILQPTKIILPMLDCCNNARIESKFSYPLCLSQHMLHLYATDYMNFTYICNFSCILSTGNTHHVKTNTTCYIHIYSAYTLFFLFLPF